MSEGGETNTEEKQVCAAIDDACANGWTVINFNKRDD